MSDVIHSRPKTQPFAQRKQLSRNAIRSRLRQLISKTTHAHDCQNEAPFLETVGYTPSDIYREKCGEAKQWQENYADRDVLRDTQLTRTSRGRKKRNRDIPTSASKFDGGAKDCSTEATNVRGRKKKDAVRIKDGTRLCKKEGRRGTRIRKNKTSSLHGKKAHKEMSGVSQAWKSLFGQRRREIPGSPTLLAAAA